jgi:hypothetical protein
MWHGLIIGRQAWLFELVHARFDLFTSAKACIIDDENGLRTRELREICESIQ